MNQQYPLREQRKQRSREALVRSAARLFARRGFAATTLEEVADDAGLHVQTLYRHFPNKAELAAAVDQQNLESFREAFRTRDADTLHFWRAWVEQAARRLTADGGNAYRKGLLNFYNLPSLSSTYLQTWNEYEEILAEGLREDFGAPDGPRANLPMLVACMLWAGTRRAAYDWANASGKRDLVAECVAVVDTVIAEFGHYLKAS
ncbi:MAG: TetR/AcrR family transcriptional regulator [Pseudomonadales bacterium]